MFYRVVRPWGPERRQAVISVHPTADAAIEALARLCAEGKRRSSHPDGALAVADEQGRLLLELNPASGAPAQS